MISVNEPCSTLGIAADEIMIKLKDQGRMTRPFFGGLHDQPVLKEMGFIVNVYDKAGN